MATIQKTQQITTPLITIKPSTGWVSLGLREVWAYRELLYFFVWRDIKVRYKQTVLGASWAILQPLVTMIVFTIFFGGLAGIPSDGIPYPIFSFAALVPWTFFSNGLSTASGSLVGNTSLLKKIYFPRLIIPLSAILSGVVDFLLAFAVLIAMIVVYMASVPVPLIARMHSFVPLASIEIASGIQPSLNILWLPLFLLLAMITALGVGLWLAALNVQFRDVRYTIGFMTRLWLFITPVVYPSSMLEEKWQLLYALNPMAGVIEGFRWALLGTDTAPGPMVIVSSLVAILLLVSGVFYFRRMEKTFADVI